MALVTSCRNLYYKGYRMYNSSDVDRKAREWEVGTAFEKYEYINSKKFPLKKVFIHQGKNVWEYTDMKVEIKKNKLSGRFVPVDTSEYGKHLYYVRKELENNRIKNYTDKNYAANQLHIIIFDSIIFHRDTINEIHFSDVAALKDYRHFQGKERGVRVLSTLIPIAGGITVYLLIIAVLGGIW